jgi:hypothetical protein
VEATVGSTGFWVGTFVGTGVSVGANVGVAVGLGVCVGVGMGVKVWVGVNVAVTVGVLVAGEMICAMVWQPDNKTAIETIQTTSATLKYFIENPLIKKCVAIQFYQQRTYSI